MKEGKNNRMNFHAGMFHCSRNNSNYSSNSVLEPPIPIFLAITPCIPARLSDYMVVILPDKDLKITKTL